MTDAATAEPLLAATGLRKTFGGLAANDDFTVEVAHGTIHALIGPNGAGKSTTINLLSGELKADAGVVRFDGADISRLRPHLRAQRGLSRSYQVASLFGQFTALDNVAMAVQARTGHAFRFIAPARRDRVLRDPAMRRLEALGLAAIAERPVSSLAHGERRQIELAMVLATEPRMLLLDEPMAGMGRAEREEMVAMLNRLKGSLTILLVEHDMDVVFALADTISVMVKGRSIACGPPAAIRADAAVQAAYLGDY